MLKYVLKRIGYMLITLFIIATATFFMMHSIPGDPLGAMANKLPEQAKANYYAKYGLDKPLTEQYTIFMKNLITKGDLGESLKYPGKSITETLLTNSKVSGVTGGLALVFGVAIGVTLGIVAALNKTNGRTIWLCSLRFWVSPSQYSLWHRCSSICLLLNG